MGRKKPFIKPNEGVKFYLVNRSQKDPLYLDENLGEHVLVPADPGVRKELIDAVNGLHLKPKLTESEKEAKKRQQIEEQHKFGIYFDDGYNYLQHLKEIDAHEEEVAEMDMPEMLKVGGVMIKNEDGEKKNPKKLQLPSTVFASQFEEDVGYFNQAAPDHDPKIHWDPDIVKILDEDSDVDYDDEENFLEDDFFKKANMPEVLIIIMLNISLFKFKQHYIFVLIKKVNQPKDLKNKSFNVDEDEDEYDEEYDSDQAENHDDFFDGYSESQSVREFETKSRFTEYSMTSSVIRRNEGLRNLDDQFENLMAQYDDDQIGGLDMEEIDGVRTDDDIVLKEALAEFETMMEKVTYSPPKNKSKTKTPKLGALREEEEEEERDEDEEESDETETDDTECGSEDDDGESDNEKAKKNYEMVKFKLKKDKDDRLDCESILSTYSTLYNHPAVITEKKPAIELSKKSGLPLGNSTLIEKLFESF